MDRSNLNSLKAIQPSVSKAKLLLLLEYCGQTKLSEVPDPYYSDDQGFDYVLDLIEDACVELLNEIKLLVKRN